jgi:hypothetical protein
MSNGFEVIDIKNFKIKIHSEGIIEIFNDWDKSERYGLFISDLDQLEELRKVCEILREKLELKEGEKEK